MRTIAWKGAAVMALGIAAASACSAESGKPATGMDKHAMPASANKTGDAQGASQGTGKVAKVDRAAGRITLDHEPIPSVGWPAMTMAFSVSDPKLLDGVQPGQKVDFTFVRKGSDYVVTAMK